MKVSSKYLIGISIILIVILGIFTLKSNLPWLIFGSPQTHVVRGGEGLAIDDINHNGTLLASLYTMNISYLASGHFYSTQSSKIIWDSSVSYYPHNILLFNYSIKSKELPVFFPSFNFTIINVSMWFMAYIFEVQPYSYNSNPTTYSYYNYPYKYVFVAAVNKSIILNSTKLSQTGTLSWTPPHNPGPFAIFGKDDTNYTVTYMFFETHFGENMTTKTYQYEYSGIGLTGVNQNFRALQNPTGAFEYLLSFADPVAGAIFTYKNWSVTTNIMIFISGIALASALLILAIYLIKRTSNTA